MPDIRSVDLNPQSTGQALIPRAGETYSRRVCLAAALLLVVTCLADRFYVTVGREPILPGFLAVAFLLISFAFVGVVLWLCGFGDGRRKS